jgi:biopolymer transport protein ExbD
VFVSATRASKGQFARTGRTAVAGADWPRHPTSEYAMAFQTTTASRDITDMNITPLVDVMLVLLIIFMVTAPMLSRPLTLDLPTRTPPLPPPSETVTLRIDGDGRWHWNGMPMARSAIDAMLQIEASRAVAPLLTLEIDDNADYAHLADALGLARAAGIEKIGLP